MKKALAHVSAHVPMHVSAHVPAPRLARAPFPLRARLGGGLALLGLLAGLGLVAVRPARTAGGPVPVSVANPSLAVSDAGAARQAVTGSLLLSGAVFDSPSGTLYTVPANKRLVIETVAALSSRHDANAYTIEVDTTTGGVFEQTFFTLMPSGAALYASLAQPVRLYADPGSKVQVSAQNTGNNAPFTGLSFSGHLVDL